MDETKPTEEQSHKLAEDLKYFSQELGAKSGQKESKYWTWIKQEERERTLMVHDALFLGLVVVLHSKLFANSLLRYQGLFHDNLYFI